MSTELARIVRPQSISEYRQLAEDAARSGFFPVKRPEEALIILMTGAELGLKPMQAMRGIYVVNGKPVLSADMLVAAVRASGACESWRVVVSTTERCEIVTRRKGETIDEVGVWTRADAERAGVFRKPGPWQQYPDRMLRHRCASDLARRVYPDVCLGVYVPGELDDDAPAEAPQPARVEVVEAKEMPLALQRVYDDVKQYAAGDGSVALTLEQAEAIVASHYDALSAEGSDCIADAHAYLKEQVAPGLKVKLHAVFAKFGQRLAEQRRAAHAAKQGAPVAAESSAPAEVSGDTLFPAICAAQTLEALVAAWMAHRDVIADWSEGDVFNARGDAVAQLNTILGGTDEAKAAKLFDDAVAAAKKGPRGPDDQGPRPGRRVRPVGAADANGSSAESASSAGATARAAHPSSASFVYDPDVWVEHVKGWASPYAVINGWAKHAPAFRMAGCTGDRVRVARDRLAALRGCDEDIAERTLLDAEKAADHEARFPTPEARRQKRNTDEKGPRSLPEMVAAGRAAVG